VLLEELLEELLKELLEELRDHDVPFAKLIVFPLLLNVVLSVVPLLNLVVYVFPELCVIVALDHQPSAVIGVTL
jgi:hypothetical protein